MCSVVYLNWIVYQNIYFKWLQPRVGLVNRSEATTTIRFLDTVNRLTAQPTQYI